MKTTAAVLVGIGQPLALQELTIPSLQAGQCLVRIQAAGICRTQLNEQAGLKGDDPYIPHLLGHEAAGYVEKVGAGVTKIKPGEYVVVSWIKGAGADVAGATYTNTKKQTIRSGAAAVFTQYAIVAENRLTPISEEVPPAVAALFGCAIPTGVGVIFNTLKLQPGQSVAIFGVGGVGGAALLGARAAGCDPIIAVDVAPEKLPLAQQLGATHVIPNTGNDAAARIHALLPGGVMAAIEATGIAAVGEAAFASLGKRGRLVIAGHPAHGSTMSIDPFQLIEGRSIQGTWGGDGKPEIDIPRYVELYLSGKLPVNSLITHRYPLAQINEALATMRSGKTGRVVVEFKDE